jgi:hypothetical protein
MAAELFLHSLWVLLIMHALCDYPLQGDFLARFKAPSGGQIGGETVWPIVLTSHALIHAGGVLVVTGSVALSVAEFVAHWLIDFGKGRGWFGFRTDQALHVACKIAWAALLVAPNL